MAGVPPSKEEATQHFLQAFSCVALSHRIARQAMVVRRERKLQLPDAISLATAQVENRLLLTRNTRDLRSEGLVVRILYRL